MSALSNPTGYGYSLEGGEDYVDRYGTELGGYDEFRDRERHQTQYRAVSSFAQMTVCLKIFKYLFAVGGGGESDPGSAGSRGKGRAPSRPPPRPPPRSRRPAQPTARPRPTAQLVWQQRVPALGC